MKREKSPPLAHGNKNSVTSLHFFRIQQTNPIGFNFACFLTYFLLGAFSSLSVLLLILLRTHLISEPHMGNSVEPSRPGQMCHLSWCSPHAHSSQVCVNSPCAHAYRGKRSCARVMAKCFRSMNCGRDCKDSTYRAKGLRKLRGPSQRWWQPFRLLQVLSDVCDLGPALQRPLQLQKEVVYSPAGPGRLFFIREHLWWVFEVDFSWKRVQVYALVCHLHHMAPLQNIF